MKKTTLYIVTFVLSNISFQTKAFTLSLSQIINFYSLNSPIAKMERLKFQNEILEFTNYKRSFLPAISFTFNPINFNRSLKLLQSPENGNYSYVEDYSNTSTFGISISQKVGLTGGHINIGTDLSFLNEFSRHLHSFSTSPFYISYSQDIWGGRKSSLLEKKIKETENLISIHKYCSRLADIQSKAVELYFMALSEKLSAELSQQNISINDTLLYIGKTKHENGHITEYDYKQIELQALETQHIYRESLKQYDEAIHNLQTYLGIDTDSLSLDLPALELPLFVDDSLVAYHVNQNNPQILELQSKRLKAKQNQFTAKKETFFNGSINLNYGINQYADNFLDAYRHANNRQSITIGLQIPIWQWGVNHNKRKIADNNYLISTIDIENKKREFKDEIRTYINTYNHSICLWELSEASYRLAREQYIIAVKSFTLGEFSVYELTSAKQKQSETMQQYYTAMKDVYTSYFQLRKISLYDFQSNQNLENIYLKDI